MPSFIKFHSKSGLFFPAGFFILLGLMACGPQGESGRKPVARVFDVFLYEDQLREIIPPDATGEDSAAIVNGFVQNWIKETLLLRKAEENSESMSEISRKLEDYRKSLVIYEYEKALVAQYLDTVVSTKELEEYYEKNKESFSLRDNIIKVTFVKIPRKAPEINKVRKWYRSDEAADKAQLAGYCSRYAENYYFDDSWLLFDDILKEVPIKLYDKESFLRNNRFIEVEDSLHYFFVNIRGFQVKNSISPLAFERENIRSIIINRRKVDLIQKIKNEIFAEAKNQKNVELFNP